MREARVVTYGAVADVARVAGATAMHIVANYATGVDAGIAAIRANVLAASSVTIASSAGAITHKFAAYRVTVIAVCADAGVYAIRSSAGANL